MNARNRIHFFGIALLAFVVVAAPASAGKEKRYGIEGKLVNYDAEASTLEVEVLRTKVSGQYGAGGVAGKPAPKTIKQGQKVVFQVVPEGSVLRRTVIKAKTGGGLDTTGTKEGFQKAVSMIPKDQSVVFSFEKNPEGDPDNGVPEWLLKMVQMRLSEAELEERLDRITVEE